MLTPKIMKANLFAFLLLFVWLCGYSQQGSKSESKYPTRIIPFVKYNPSDFRESIIRSYISPDKFLMAKHNGTVYEFSLKTGGFRDGKIDAGYFKANNIDSDMLLAHDSLFYFYMDKFSMLNYKHLGIMKNNQVFIIKNNNFQQLYPFAQYIISEYGSIDKFKEQFISNIQYELDFGMENELIVYDKETATNFLTGDYKVHEAYNPKDTIGTIDRFMDMLGSFILIENGQKSKLKEVIYKQIAYPQILPKRFINMPYFDNSEDIMIFDADISVLLPINLTKEQYLTMMRKIKVHNFTRARYLEYIQKVYPEFDKNTGNLQKLINQIPNIW